jgi:hypothetical protein
MLRESVRTGERPEESELFGRLLSPVYGLRPSETVCISAQVKLAKGGFGWLTFLNKKSIDQSIINQSININFVRRWLVNFFANID